MEMSLADICDHWTILRMKIRFASELLEEEAKYRKEVIKAIKGSPLPEGILVPLVDIMAANAGIWQQEAAIRKEYDKDIASQGALTLEEIGRRSVAIREINARRIEAKHCLDRIEGRVQEIKIDHLSDTKKSGNIGDGEPTGKS